PPRGGGGGALRGRPGGGAGGGGLRPAGMAGGVGPAPPGRVSCSQAPPDAARHPPPVAKAATFGASTGGGPEGEACLPLQCRGGRARAPPRGSAVDQRPPTPPPPTPPRARLRPAPPAPPAGRIRRAAPPCPA